MKPKTITFVLDTADADGICASQTPLAAGALTIDGALATSGVATLDVARHVSITSTGDESTKTFTVTGTNRYGATITETTLGPSSTTINLSKNFKTVTAVSVNAATAGAITVGTTNEADTQPVPVEYLSEMYSYEGKLSAGASLKYAVQYTFDDPFDPTFEESTAEWITHASDKTGTFDDIIDRSVRAIRARVTEYTSGTLYFTIITPSI